MNNERSYNKDNLTESLNILTEIAKTANYHNYETSVVVNGNNTIQIGCYKEGRSMEFEILPQKRLNVIIEDRDKDDLNYSVSADKIDSFFDFKYICPKCNRSLPIGDCKSCGMTFFYRKF